MSRHFDQSQFLETYDRWITNGRFQEEPSYYPRYLTRYEGLMRKYAELAGPPPIDMLDIGGGIYAVLAHKLWGDRAAVADVERLSYVEECGVPTHIWNLAQGDAPFEDKFDVIVFSEVIEHLPIPGYVALERLRKVLKPGGILICTTPNFYRLRNVVYVAIGKSIFDNMKLPEDGATGHVYEYDEPRLRWVMERAGFHDIDLTMHQFPHQPKDPVFRMLSRIGSPLLSARRFRECMIAVGKA
jgi:SAM-dependent methyltransferase